MPGVKHFLKINNKKLDMQYAVRQVFSTSNNLIVINYHEMGVLCLSPLTIQRRVMLLPAEAKIDGLPSMDNDGTEITFSSTSPDPEYVDTCDCEVDHPAELLLGADLTLVLPGIVDICVSREERELRV